MRRRKQSINWPTGHVAAGPNNPAGPPGMGDVFTGIASSANVAVNILNDPALPQLAQQIQTLHDLEQPNGSGDNVPGIGLGRIVSYVDLYTKYRSNPMLYGTLAVGLILGIPFLIGYTLGRR